VLIVRIILRFDSSGLCLMDSWVQSTSEENLSQELGSERRGVIQQAGR